MKIISFLLMGFCLSLNTQAQTETAKSTSVDSSKIIQVVEASCGQCQFKMAGKGCTLAVRINGKAYFVDGTDINKHGDAHASDGFCEAIKKAEVKGEIVKDIFVVSYFKLINTKE